MSTDPAEEQAPTERSGKASADEAAPRSRSARPTVDQLSEWSFPASDPPPAWNWEVERLSEEPGGPDHSKPEHSP